MDHDTAFMARAFELAQLAQRNGEVPVGAVVIKNNQILAEGWNQVIRLNDPSAHAEMLALREAGVKTNNYRLPDTTLYVTLEPCFMCAGAMLHARISRLVYAVDDTKTGACGSVLNLFKMPQCNHKILTKKGVMRTRCRSLLINFFKEKRLQSA